MILNEKSSLKKYNIAVKVWTLITGEKLKI
jgi:hypothetical protein